MSDLSSYSICIAPHSLNCWTKPYSTFCKDVGVNREDFLKLCFTVPVLLRCTRLNMLKRSDSLHVWW